MPSGKIKADNICCCQIPQTSSCEPIYTTMMSKLFSVVFRPLLDSYVLEFLLLICTTTMCSVFLIKKMNILLTDLRTTYFHCKMFAGIESLWSPLSYCLETSFSRPVLFRTPKSQKCFLCPKSLPWLGLFSSP